MEFYATPVFQDRVDWVVELRFRLFGLYGVETYVAHARAAVPAGVLAGAMLAADMLVLAELLEIDGHDADFELLWVRYAPITPEG